MTFILRLCAVCLFASLLALASAFPASADGNRPALGSAWPRGFSSSTGEGGGTTGEYVVEDRAAGGYKVWSSASQLSGQAPAEGASGPAQDAGGLQPPAMFEFNPQSPFVLAQNLKGYDKSH
jgi:hypothetical protein